MTAFALTGQQQAFAQRVRAIAADQLRPLAAAGTPGHVNRELVKAMGELGLLPRLFPGIGDGSPVSREAATGVPGRGGGRGRAGRGHGTGSPRPGKPGPRPGGTR